MIKKSINIFWIVERIGPYHNARFNELSKNINLKINVIETNPNSETYPWDSNYKNNYQIYKINKNNEKDFNKKKLIKDLNQNLFRNKPEIIFITGWYDISHYYIMYKSFFKKIPIVLLSDSRVTDHKRIFHKELIKRFLIKGFSSALVAGKESKDYLLKLKFKKENIFTPYNVIDNNFFLSYKSKKIFKYQKYFLCIARFIKKKNHKKLLEAFEIYKRNKGKYDLIIIGEGPEEKSINQYIKDSKFSDSIIIESWKQIDELPEFYKKAKALILTSSSDQWGLVVNEAMASGTPCIVSKNCGCYIDLIENSNTGWGFNSNNSNELANILKKVDSLSKSELEVLKKNIKLKISNYSLVKFSNAVEKSIQCSFRKKKFSLISSLTSYILFKLKK